MFNKVALFHGGWPVFFYCLNRGFQQIDYPFFTLCLGPSLRSGTVSPSRLRACCSKSTDVLCCKMVLDSKYQMVKKLALRSILGLEPEMVMEMESSKLYWLNERKCWTLWSDNLGLLPTVGRWVVCYRQGCGLSFRCWQETKQSACLKMESNPQVRASKWRPFYSSHGKVSRHDIGFRIIIDWVRLWLSYI